MSPGTTPQPAPPPRLADASARPTHLLYLHGFRSSPRSTKARRMAAWCARYCPEVHWACPQLPPSPRQAAALLRDLVERWPVPTMAVIGSSLGGFYATVLAERLGCAAVLLNPAVDPARDLAAHIGEQTVFHEPALSFDFRAEFVDELRALTPASITRPERYFAVIARGDEVLDWREMAARYAGVRIKLLDDSDHALSDFDDHLPDIVRFLHLDP